MEPGIKEFLKRLAVSISTVLIWMLINSTVGIMWGYAFFDVSVSIGNIIYYIWLVVSFAVLIYFLVKYWRKPIDDLIL